MLKNGKMCLLFKKDDRRVKGNYRGVVLLAIGRKVLARGLCEEDEMVGW